MHASTASTTGKHRGLLVTVVVVESKRNAMRVGGPTNVESRQH